MIPYGHYPKGTVIEIGHDPIYARSARGAHIKAKHAFDYTSKKEGSFDAHFDTVLSPNGWTGDVYMNSFSERDRVISMPNIQDNAVASSIFLMKGDAI
jgi:hypothetical protein